MTMRSIQQIEEGAQVAVQRAIKAATKAERTRCYDLAIELHRDRREAGDPEGADAIWDLSQAIKRP